MIQTRHGARLALEPLAQVRPVREMRRQNFDRHCPIEARVASAIHLPHAAGAERGKNFVRAKP
jgi:hypothetical protein